MSISALVTFNLIVVLVLLFVVIHLLLRVRKIEEKTVDITAKEVAAFVEQMREMVVESERVADGLDTAIREREAMLEDLAGLVNNKVEQLNSLTLYETGQNIQSRSLSSETSIQNKVYGMLLSGYTKEETARKLGISITEVDLISAMIK